MSRNTGTTDQQYDLAFIGLGLSNTFTLIETLERLQHKAPARAVRVLLIEKSDNHFTGVAYGSRSGNTALLISPLAQFADAELRAKFISWICANKEALLEQHSKESGELSTQWAESFIEAEATGTLEEISVPRSFFGKFLKELAQKAINRAIRSGIATVQRITADVHDITRHVRGYKISLEDQFCRIYSQKIVLGIGMPTASTLNDSSGTPVQDVEHVVNNPYAKDVNSLYKSLASRVVKRAEKSTQPINVLVVGANASAIEAAYMLFDQPGFHSAENKISVLSPSGKFPDGRAPDPTEFSFKPKNLLALASQASNTAHEIYTAALADLAHWRHLSAGRDVPVVSFGAELMSLVERLSLSESQKFATTYGVRIGRFQRRSSDEYVNFADRLENSGKLTHVSGYFTAITDTDDQGSSVAYKPSSDSDSVVFSEKFTVVINCMGPKPLWSNQSPLVSKLIERGICSINQSGRGFIVDDEYQAANNLVVTGPLISGNVIQNKPVWHVEHCGRLAGLAGAVSGLLHRDLLCGSRIAA